jgi:hypothetical protein
VDPLTALDRRFVEAELRYRVDHLAGMTDAELFSVWPSLERLVCALSVVAPYESPQGPPLPASDWL